MMSSNQVYQISNYSSLLHENVYMQPKQLNNIITGDKTEGRGNICRLSLQPGPYYNKNYKFLLLISITQK